MPNNSTPGDSGIPEIESVNDGLHQMLWVRHRGLAIGMWACAGLFTVLIFCYVYFVANDHAIASFSENDGTIMLIIIPFIIPFGVEGYFFTKARREMMRQIAQSLGYSYAEKGDPADLTAATFQIGHSHKMYDVLTGTYRDYPVRIFSFDYTVGSGKSSHTYCRVVFELTYTNSLPHIILNPLYVFNDLGVPYGVSGTEAVQLEGDFGQHFKLSVAKDAQIQVREIFQPDLMQALIDKYSQFSIEIFSEKVYVVRDGPIYQRAGFLELHTLADTLIDSLIPGLHSAAEDQATSPVVA